MLTPDEQAALEIARQAGFLVRSGWRLAVLLAWREWCRSAGKRCVVARRGAREAVIEVDGVDVLKVAADDLQAAAERIVVRNQLTTKPAGDTLWGWES